VKDGSYIPLHTEELWKAGAELNTAAIRFAPPRIVKQLNTSLPKIQSAGKADGGQKKTLQQARDNLISMAARSQLYAFGYELPRRGPDKPIELPKDIWRGIINWDKSSISGNGLNIIAVRVIQPADAYELLNDLVANPEPRSAGKPSLKHVIHDAYEYFRDIGDIDYSKPMASFYNKIRAWLINKHPDYAGVFSNMHNETIRINIRKSFDEDKAERNR
jgi:hypothetical protein